jgi:hypothetical protein
VAGFCDECCMLCIVHINVNACIMGFCGDLILLKLSSLVLSFQVS